MIVVHIVSGLGDGGAEAVLFRLCVSDRNHSHIVISLTDKGKYGPLLQEAGVTVEALNMTKGRFKVIGLLKLFKLLGVCRIEVDPGSRTGMRKV